MDDRFLKVAKESALEAGKIITKYAGKKHQYNIKNKDSSDFATEADIEAEKMIVKMLTTNFRDHNIIAEEQTQIDKKSKFTWVVDPMDGTIAFASGIPYFSISIGLLEERKPVLGVVYNVSFKYLYWAQKGQGAFLNSKSIHVSNKKSLDESVGVLDFGHNQKRQQKIDLYVKPLITKIGYAYSFGSAVATMGMVAQGILDVCVNQAWVWDFAAGAIIIREAGGKVTDFEGKEPDWNKNRLNIVASNGLVHDAILEVLNNNSYNNYCSSEARTSRVEHSMRDIP